MSDMTKIVYLSEEQFEELKTNGAITVDGVTVAYDENYLFLTPAEDANEVVEKANEIIDTLNALPRTHVVNMLVGDNAIMNMIVPSNTAEQFTDASGLVNDMESNGFSGMNASVLATGGGSGLNGLVVIGAYASGGQLYAVFSDGTSSSVTVNSIYDIVH